MGEWTSQKELSGENLGAIDGNIAPWQTSIPQERIYLEFVPAQVTNVIINNNSVGYNVFNIDRQEKR